jgi:hypothetical protein
MAGDTSGVLELATNGSTTAITIDTSQRAAFVAGTAALPAITTTGDTNTGVFFPAADTIAFAEGGTESMRIDSSGNVGIGTASPSYKLQVATIPIAVSQSGSVLFGANDQYGTRINTSTTVGGGPYSQIMAAKDNNGYLTFTTGASDTERMRIDGSGNLLIGKTTTAGTTQGAYISNAGQYVVSQPSSTGAVFFQNTSGGGTVGTITINASTTTYGTSSDYRLKENVAPMTGALDKVALLKPVTYKWKIDGSNGQGFIAHELQEIVPEAVAGEKDAVDEDGNIKPQGIDTSFLVATLTAAIQEQQTIINDLKARVTALEAK